MQVELVRFHHKYRFYSRLRLRSEEFRDTRYVHSLYAFIATSGSLRSRHPGRVWRL